MSFFTWLERKSRPEPRPAKPVPAGPARQVQSPSAAKSNRPPPPGAKPAPGTKSPPRPDAAPPRGRHQLVALPQHGEWCLAPDLVTVDRRLAVRLPHSWRRTGDDDGELEFVNDELDERLTVTVHTLRNGSSIEQTRRLVEDLVFARRKAIALRSDGQAVVQVVQWRLDRDAVEAAFESHEPANHTRQACMLRASCQRIVATTLYRDAEHAGQPPFANHAREVMECLEF